MKRYASPQKIRDSVIGSNNKLQGPFGSKPIVYADTTASGKAVSFIEDYIQDVVLPFYANTHTEASATGLQTQSFREDARNIIRRTFHAPKEEYAVIFCGSGSTAAMNKLANAFGISPLVPAVEDPSKRAVVFISSQEHDSNELLWRESGNVDCVVIPCDDAGLIDEIALEEELIKHQDRPLKLASLSAASNVTGIRYDTRRITNLVHRYGAWAAWDFAAAGSHVGIDMTEEDLDAIYLSPHKYVGGPGTPGVLVARRSLFTNTVPTTPGGGTVEYVQPHGHKYLGDIEAREEGGTPAIVDSIRCGLALDLHDKVGPKWIEEQETKYLNLAFKKWSENKNIVILGNTDVKRVSIVSFLVKSPNAGEGFLHYNFVVALLNDLFGIQTRGGCSCAGPLGHLILNIDEETSDVIVAKMNSIGEAVKPGWTRLSFSYYMSLDTVKYIVDAVDLVAREGYKLLPKYDLNPKTGSWTYNGYKSQPLKLWDFSTSYFKPKTHRKKDLQGCLNQAKRIFRNSKTIPSSVRRVSENYLTEDFTGPIRDDKNICWFIISEKSHLDVYNKYQQQVAQFQESLTSVTCPPSDHDRYGEEDETTMTTSASIASRIPTSVGGGDSSFRSQDAWPEMVGQGRRRRRKKKNHLSNSLRKSLKKKTSFSVNNLKSSITSLSSMMQVTSINKREIMEMREQALLAKPFHGPQSADPDHRHPPPHRQPQMNTTVCNDTPCHENAVDSNQSSIWYPTLLDHIQYGKEVFV